MSKFQFGKSNSTTSKFRCVTAPHQEIQDGAFAVLCSREDNTDRVPFTIDCNIGDLSSTAVGLKEKLAIMKSFHALLMGKYQFLYGTAKTLSFEVRGSFGCDTLLISMKVVDMVMEIIEILHGGSSDVASECKFVAMKVIDELVGKEEEACCFLAEHRPQHFSTLMEACLEPAHPREASFTTALQFALFGIGSMPNEVVLALISRITDVITAFKDNSPCDPAFFRAAELFQWNFVGHSRLSEQFDVTSEASFLDMMADFLRHVAQTCDSSVDSDDDEGGSSKPALSLQQILNSAPSSIISGHVPVMEGILQLACFSPSSEVRKRYLDFLCSLGQPATLLVVQRKKMAPALDWWTDRCLPTWIDMLVQSEENSALTVVCCTILSLLSDQELIDEETPKIPLFAVKLVDSGGYNKIKVCVDTLPEESGLRLRLDTICERLEKSRDFMADSTVVQLQFVSWSWKCHDGFPRPVRMAVCGIFSAPMYKHPRTGEICNLPGEVAYEICSFLPLRRCNVPKTFIRRFPTTTRGSDPTKPAGLLGSRSAAGFGQGASSSLDDQKAKTSKTSRVGSNNSSSTFSSLAARHSRTTKGFGSGGFAFKKKSNDNDEESC